MPEKSILDARLAEIDRRLRTIQTGLEPALRPVAAAPGAPHEALAPVIPPEAAPVPKRVSTEDRQVSELVARLTALVDAQERLLASARALADRSEPAGDAGRVVSVSAGPFAGTEALRRFEASLQALPQVRSATVREYEGADRAIVDVHLFEPTS
ncbi:MAG TPA: hypothetical protein VMF14_02625 [Solirubrobacteraceae bacterium]|nr:hypothetical protein [Solirubrobacteraceae bacterium]